MDNTDVNSQDQRVPVNPFTEIPFIPLPQRDATRGGRYFPFAREISVGDGGANVFRVDKQGMWLGAETFALAPFSVSMLGEVIAEALTIIGGTITGATIQTSALAATGIKLDTSSLRGYNSSGDNTLTISTTTGFISLSGYSAHAITRTLTLAPGSAQPAVGLEDSSSTDVGFQWQGPTSGSNAAARTDIPAFYHYNHDCAHGDGFTSKNTDTSWDGKHFKVIPTSTKNTPAFYIESSSLTGTEISQISTEGFLSFPAFHHYSEFEENPAVLASTVIAKAFWQGGGTSGTQEIRAAAADGYDDDVTYIRLSTTATASRSSTLQFYRSVDLNLLSRFEALVRGPSALTTTAVKIGWYYDATHYAYFLFDTDQHASKLYFAYRNGGAETLNDLGVSMPSGDVMYKYTIQMYAGKIYVFFEDVLKATITTTIPTYGYPYFYVDNKATAVERTLDIDYEKHWYGRKRNI